MIVFFCFVLTSLLMFQMYKHEILLIILDLLLKILKWSEENSEEKEKIEKSDKINYF